MPKPKKATREQYKKAIDFGCVVCFKMYGIKSYETQIHHLRTNTGMSMKSKDFIPLCYRHHMLEYHKDPKKFEEDYGTQESLLELYKQHEG